MRILIAAALAASLGGAAWAAEASSKVVTEASAKAERVLAASETKQWRQTQCWICYPNNPRKQ
jgi:hypothetical protein